MSRPANSAGGAGSPEAKGQKGWQPGRNSAEGVEVSRAEVVKMNGAARIVLLTMLLASLLAASPAPATSHACGGQWLGGAECTFELRGTQFTGFAEAFSGPGLGFAVVDLRILTPTGFTVAWCGSGGAEFANCVTEGGLDLGLGLLPVGVPLTCKVEGNVRGNYFCESS